MQKRVVIGVAGPSASGKSLLSSAIVREFKADEVVVISEDSYYRSQDHLEMSEREKMNYDHPSAFDHELLLRHIQELLNGNSVEVPVYDYAHHTRHRDRARHVDPSYIIVLEGILLFTESKLRSLMDIKIYIDTPLDLCLLRRVRRDVVERGRSLESVLSQYQGTVRPMLLQFIEPSKRYADVIVPSGGMNEVAISLIEAHMRDVVEQHISG